MKIMKINLNTKKSKIIVITLKNLEEQLNSICNLRYKVPKSIPLVIQNRSTYDNHFIIKQLPEEFEREFKCLGENTEKYITFSVPIKKEVVNGKEKEDKNSKKRKRKQSHTK